MRRKPGTLVPLELAICVSAAALKRRGVDEFHGYEIAKTLGEIGDHKLLTAYGTLYRALGRLEQMGMLRSEWEDRHIAARENRPGRRLYSITPLGERAVDESRRAETARAPKRTRRKWAPA